MGKGFDQRQECGMERRLRIGGLQVHAAHRRRPSRRLHQEQQEWRRHAGNVLRETFVQTDTNGDGVIDEFDDPAISVLNDPYSGFGPEIDPTTGLLADENKGANRYALTATFNYLLDKNVTLRAEYRLDGSSLRTFFNTKDGSYSKTNNLLGLQLIYFF